jgi:hypothetical protein
MKKKISTVVFILIIVTILIYILPKISIKDYDKPYDFGNDKAYELGINIYGNVIFKNTHNALKKFQEDYQVGLDYLNEKGYDEFSTKTDVLRHYGVYSWQEVVDDSNNKDIIKEQLSKITKFSYTYYNSSWQHYFPFYKSLS